MPNNPVDYQVALDAFRQNEHTPDNPVRISALPVSPPLTGDCVDYQAVIKAWDKEQKGKNIVHMKTGKRNPSHDPVCRKPSVP